MPGDELGLGGQPNPVAVRPGGDVVPKSLAQSLIRRRSLHGQMPPRATSCAAMTLRWISLVPSPTIISGASRK